MRKTTKTNNIVSNEAFGMRLRQLRKEKNLNQSDIAEKLRVSRSSVANWENGIRFPDCQSVKQLAVIFGVSVDYLYGQSNHRYNINIPDYFELDVKKDDLLLLCSDGLSSYAEDIDIAQIVAKTSVSRCCEQLIDYVNKHGGRDNVTVAVVSI